MADINITATEDEAELKKKELKDYVNKALEQQEAIEKSMSTAQDENSLEWYNEVKETFDTHGKQAFANSKGALQGLQKLIQIGEETASEVSSQK